MEMRWKLMGELRLMRGLYKTLSITYLAMMNEVSEQSMSI
jgi:hypothetical protein